MKKLLLFLLAMMPILTFAQPSNNTCASSTNITVSTAMASTYTADTIDATETVEGSCQIPSITDPDVWYDFTMPVNGNLRLTGISSNDYITIYDSCGGTEIACFFNEGVIYGLNAGQDYILKFARYNNGMGMYDFTVQAFEVPDNNECANSETIVLSNTMPTSFTAITIGASETVEGSCESPGIVDPDVWFNFTMPVDGSVLVSNNSTNNYINIYDSCGGTEIACFFGNQSVYNLTGGVNYILRFARYNNGSGTYNFTMQAFEPPSNDLCANSETIAVSATVANTYTANTEGASDTLEGSCEINGITDPDVWYNFTMPVTGNLVVSNISNNDYINVYDSCGGMEIDCFFNDGIVQGLTGGQSYILKFARYNNGNGMYNFTVKAEAVIANDDCENREVLNVTTANPLTITPIDFSGATEDDPALTTNCETNASIVYFDVWYEFTMPVNGNIVITDAQNVENFTLYDGCGGTEISCDTDDSILNNLTAGTTYVLRYSERELFANLSDFTIQAFATVANDNCADRETITVTTTEANTFSADFRGASEDDPAFTTNCESNASIEYFDVWYEFTMPVNGNIVITDAQNVENFTLYDGCGGNELSCDTDDSILNNLTAGTTYVLRYSERELFAGASDFSIQAFATVANDNCFDRETIAVTTTEANTYAVDFRGASEDDPAFTTNCESNASIEYFDVWYEFTMPVNGNAVITEAQNVENFTLYNGCGGTEISCDTDNSILNNLSAGVTYVLRYSERELFAGASDFSIQAFEKADNDDCEDATELNISALTPTQITIDFRTASNDTEISCENNNNLEYPDVWYAFTMPVDGELQINNINNLVNSAFFDACGGNELACFNNDGSLFNVAAGTNIKLRTSVRELFAGEFTFDIIAVPNPLPTCTGTTEFIGGTWNNGIPDNTMNAIIRSNYNTGTTIDPLTMLPYGSLEACSVSIDSGRTLTIAPEDFLEVTGNILVNGTLNVEHQASVIQLDPLGITTNNGTINVNVTTPVLDPRDFMIMGSPMSNEFASSVFATARQVREHDTNLFIPNIDVATEFPLAENFADDNGDNWILHTGLLNPAEGYFVQPQPDLQTGGSFDLIFNDGTLNNGDVTLPILFNSDKNSSPNILSNPYPSAIFADDFINVNPTVDEVYFWEHLTEPSLEFPGYSTANFSMEDISMYNLMGGVKAASDPSLDDTKPNGLISTAQGFGIKANAAGTATFSNAMRRLSGNTTLRTAEETNKLWLSITNQEYNLAGSTLIGFTNYATKDLDAGYDSNRLANVVSIFSGIENNDIELGIQGREVFNEDITIPIGFSSQIDASSTFKIAISDMQGTQINEATVFLLDNITGDIINLSETPYEFESEKGQFPNRFVLFFNRNVLSSTTETTAEFSMVPNPGIGVFTIKTKNQIIKGIVVYDYLGRIILNKNELSISEINIDLNEKASGIYLVQVRTNNGALTKKYIKK